MNNDIQDVLDELVGISEAAELMGVTRSYVHQLVNSRRLNSFTVGSGSKMIKLVKKADALKFERADK